MSLILPPVCAENISSLTSQAHFSSDVPPQPPLPQLIADARGIFEGKYIEAEETAVVRKRELSHLFLPRALNMALMNDAYAEAEQARENLRTFDSMIKNPPAGWQPAAVWHDHRILRMTRDGSCSSLEYKRLRDEFRMCVRRPYAFEFARRNPGYLYDIGAERWEIAKLQKNEEISSAHHKPKFNLDHLAALAGAGLWCLTAGKDPARSQTLPPVRIVNWAGNIFPIGKKDHDNKTMIVDEQLPPIMDLRGRWIVSIIPTRKLVHSFSEPPRRSEEFRSFVRMPVALKSGK